MTSLAEKCTAMAESLRVRGRISFICCVDGSRFSDAALESTKHLMKKHDHICVLHAYSSVDDQTLPLHKKSQSVKEKYKDNLLATFPPERFSFSWVDRADTGTSVREEIIRAADGKIRGVHPDFLVAGYEGWRRHESSKDGRPTNVGSTADFSLRHVHAPVILIKEDACSAGPKSYIMAVDSSYTSKLGLDILYTLLTSRDTLTVVHVITDATDDGTLDVTKRYFEEDLEKHCPTASATFHVIVKPGATPVADALEEYVNARSPDFFVIAPKARADAGFTSLTELMILRIRSNLILCKA